jgi:Thermolysin metallopeptidase, alpha-helical domain/Thermolysin metallopeptidase, catalytic domain/Emfourin
MIRCHFVPPFLLQTLADRADDAELADLARSSLRTDERLRAQRLQAAPSPGRRPAERPHRSVFTADNGSTLPGRQVRAEGEPPVGDAAADEAYEGVGAAWTLFHEVYDRDSFDDAGHPLDATVHYERRYANAFWDGRQLVFGDGDGGVFRRFTGSPDVVAHELTHAVTQHTAGLAYSGQAGALNESMSDVFAALTVQRALGQSAEEASWLVGEEIFFPGVDAVALRSMKAPGTAYDDPRLGTDPQPATMAGYVETTDDNGGVHINSGIPNHAFYLAATAVGGPAWEHAGAAWYAALTDRAVGPHTDFDQWASATVAAAARLFGERSGTAGAVRDAWSAVGVQPRAVAGPHAPAAGAAAPSPGRGGHQVTVRRTGGITGLTVERRIDTATAAGGGRVEQLLAQVPLGSVATGASQPDRYVFAIDVDGHTVQVHEPDLGPELAELVDIVLHGET